VPFTERRETEKDLFDGELQAGQLNTLDWDLAVRQIADMIVVADCKR
jgi:hypothetical protein